MKAKAVLSIFFMALLVVASLSATEVSGASIEVIVNGGFETGDFTGWEHQQGDIYTKPNAHTGNYSAWLYECWLQQTFTSSVTATSFTFWAKNYNAEQSFLHTVVVHYEDDTEDGLDFRVSGWNETTYENYWEFFNLTSQLKHGKAIKWIKFLGDTGQPYLLDDVSLLAETQTQRDEGGVPNPYPPPPPQNESQNGGGWAGGFVQLVGTLKEIVQRLLGNPLYLLLLLLMVAVLAHYSTRKQRRR
jgi:hypothetical protein